MKNKSSMKEFEEIVEEQGFDDFLKSIQQSSLILNNKNTIEAEAAKDADVLVVEDCQFNFIAISGLLTQFNYKSHYCLNGQEAIQAIQARVGSGKPMYKLIMMDFSMPICDGPTASNAIRNYLAENGFARDQ